MRNAILGTLFIAAGCVGATPDDEISVEEPSLRAELARGATFAIDPQTAEASLIATLHRPGGPEAAEIALDVDNGETEVWTVGETLAVTSTLAVAPIALPADLGPGDLTLVDIVVTLDATCTPAWRGLAPVDCETEADVLVSWKLASGGQVHPLGDLALEGVHLAAHVAADGVELSGEAPGSLWRWADVFELGDVSLHVVGSSTTR